MKAILEFNLPEDQVEFDMAVDSRNYFVALLEFQNCIRNWRKYEDKESVEIDLLSDTFQATLVDNNVDLDKIP